MITTIFIDIDNTLLDFDLCAADSIRSGFADWKIPYTDFIFDTFREINESLWKRIEKGTLTREELLKTRWQIIFDKLGIKKSGIEFEQVFIRYLTQSHSQVEGAAELVKYLSRKYMICATSNAPHEQQLIRLEKAGMLQYITHVFTSEQIGYSKPGKEFFDACFAQLKNTNKDEVLLIGDSITADIDGGVSYGLKTCWFNHDKVAVPPDLKADHVFNSLEEIKNLL